MGKKSRKKRLDQKQKIENARKEQEEKQYSEKTEVVFKRILKTMSWTVGICFILIIVLFEFNNRFLDQLTQVLYYIGIINLLLFSVLELISDSVKNMLNRWIGQNSQ